MKIAVYAICKNESKNINRWYESMKEADEIYVLDTGSTDNSFELLSSLGVIVKREIIKPWRFDVARNKSLDMVSNDVDICVCTDIDEVFNKGWREKLEESFKNGITRINYIYNWYILDNKPMVSFHYDKIHLRHGFKWIYPVHEILKYDGIEKTIINEDIILNHYQDRNKDRKSYLNLLKLSIKEDPNNERHLHYLGREYMYYNKNELAIKTLYKHLKVSTWNLEKSASMRFIARCYSNLERYKEANLWYEEAIRLTPDIRDAYVELAFLKFKEEKYDEVIRLCNKALKIKQKNNYYINEIFSWDHTIYDMLSISYYYKGNYKKALTYVNKVLKITCDERIKNNKETIKKHL